MENIRYFNTPFLALEHYDFDKETVHLIPENVARAHNVVALEKQTGHKNNILTVATSKPRNEIVLAVLKHHTDCHIREFEATPEAVTRIINKMYN